MLIQAVHCVKVKEMRDHLVVLLRIMIILAISSLHDYSMVNKLQDPCLTSSFAYTKEY